MSFGLVKREILLVELLGHATEFIQKRLHVQDLLLLDISPL